MDTNNVVEHDIVYVHTITNYNKDKTCSNLAIY